MHDDNPYASPKANVALPDEKPGSPYKAVALGLLVDIGGSIGSSLLLGMLYGVILMTSGASPEELRAYSTVPRGSWLWFGSHGLGYGFSVLGGYVCARIARRSEYKLGAIQAALSTAIGVVFLMRKTIDLADVVELAAGAALTMIGIRIGRARNRGRKEPA
jgi:hypothetical protein